MRFYAEVFPVNPLFQGTDCASLPALLDCLGARKELVGKNEVVFEAGAAVPELGLVLSGAIRVERLDFWGRRSILGRAEAGETFGESFSLGLPGGENAGSGQRRGRAGFGNSAAQL